MPVNYARLKATAGRLISENGQPITLRRYEREAYSPALGGYTAGGGYDDYVVSGVVMTAGEGRNDALDNRFRDGALEEQDMRVVLVSAVDLPVTPEPGDALVFGGEIWRVLGLSSLDPAGDALLHQVTVKR